MGKVIDLRGQKFDRLTVIKYCGVRNHVAYWLCKCDCGNTLMVRGSSLRNGNTRSCGCLQRELSTQRLFLHGESKSRLHNVWVCMMRRCHNPNLPAYRWYGARGIKVCDDWHEYKNFKEWALLSGYDDNAPQGVCTLDRIDNNGDYEPSNCRWVTIQEQIRNMRRRKPSIILTSKGESHSIKEWADILGIHYHTIYRRMKCGLPIENILMSD